MVRIRKLSLGRLATAEASQTRSVASSHT